MEELYVEDVMKRQRLLQGGRLMVRKGRLVNLAGKVIESPKGGICLSHPVHELVVSDKRQETKHTLF